MPWDCGSPDQEVAVAYTKFILTSNEVMPVAERAHIMAQLSAFHEQYGVDLVCEVLEPKLTVKIETDRSPSNPRTEYDNVGIMYCRHGRYTMGDKDAADPRTLKDKDIAVQRPIYMYDHSGITISHSPFSCPWDSGQLGVHYITKAKANEEWGKGKWTEEQLYRVLEGELETYDHFIRGNVWGFVVEDEEGDHVDSCWGFYGDKLEDTGILEHLTDDLHEQAKKAWEDRFQ
jgi:hypothetical protein